MLRFSRDANVAEQQMRAIIFYLTAFGYIDGHFDLSEKTFIRIYIRQLVQARASEAMPNASDEMRADVVKRFVTHFHEVFEEIDRDVRGLFTEVVAQGEKLEEFVYAKLKLRSYEIFRSFDRDNQEALIETINELISADGKVHPEEANFRDEILALLDNTGPAEDDVRSILPPAIPGSASRSTNRRWCTPGRTTTPSSRAPSSTTRPIRFASASRPRPTTSSSCRPCASSTSSGRRAPASWQARATSTPSPGRRRSSTATSTCIRSSPVSSTTSRCSAICTAATAASRRR